MFYDKDAKSISHEEYLKLTNRADYRIIGRDYVGKRLVSTVWLGMQHGEHDGHPILFETMVFGDYGGELAVWRYWNESDAILGHMKAVCEFREKLKL